MSDFITMYDEYIHQIDIDNIDNFNNLINFYDFLFNVQNNSDINSFCKLYDNHRVTYNKKKILKYLKTNNYNFILFKHNLTAIIRSIRSYGNWIKNINGFKTKIIGI